MEGKNQLLPKNMRQIGETEEQVKIYVEDEVFRFLSQMKVTTESWRVGVLLGMHEEREGVPCLFITGAIETRAADFVEGRLKFTDETWEDIIRHMEVHFPGVGICGWFVYEEAGGVVDKLSLKKTHEEAFAHGEKVLLIRDDSEEEAFYMLRKGRLEQMKGYYIYYERNEPMKSYLFGRQRGEAVEEMGSERVIEDFRAKMEEKKHAQIGHMLQQATQPTWERLRAASAAAAAVILVGLLVGYTVGDGRKTGLPAVESSTEVTGGTGVLSSDLEEKLQAASSEVKTILSMQAEAFLGGESNASREGVEENEESVGGDSGMPTEGTEESAESSSETTPAADSQKVSGRPGYLVGEGETLSQICRRLYGDLDRLEELCQLNNIQDPDTILPGQVLYLP